MLVTRCPVVVWSRIWLGPVVSCHLFSIFWANTEISTNRTMKNSRLYVHIGTYKLYHSISGTKGMCAHYIMTGHDWSVLYRSPWLFSWTNYKRFNSVYRCPTRVRYRLLPVPGFLVVQIDRLRPPVSVSRDWANIYSKLIGSSSTSIQEGRTSSSHRPTDRPPPSNCRRACWQ